MEAQSTSFVSAINMSQWKSNDMPQNSWLNGGSRWNMDSNVNDEPNNQSSDWGAKGGPNGLSLMDQKKTNSWPAISSANSNGLKPGDVIPGDVNGMNGTSSGSSLLSSDQNQGQRNGNFAGESNTLSGSIWASGSSGWGGIQTSAGSDKPETAPSSFNQGLQGVRGMQNTNSGNPWGQGLAKSPLTSESNISLSSAPSSSGATFTTSSASSNSNTHWSGNNSQGQGESPQERESSPLAKPEVSEESNFPNSSTATSTTSSVSTASDTSTVTEDSSKPTNNSAQNQQGNLTGKNSWEEDGSAWNSQSRASQGMEPGNGSGGWGSATPTSTGPSGWGDSSTAGDVSGWGALPSGNQGNKNAPTGWGHTDKVEDQETLGTEIWGSKSDASVTPSAWGKPLGAQTTGPTNQWGTKPNSAPNQQSQGGRGWGTFPSAGNGGQSGWTEAPPVAPKLPPTAWGDANSQVMRSGVKDEGLSGGSTQWGKMPINQGTKWDVDSDSKGNKHDVDNGTAVWSGQQQNPPRPPPNAWNKEPPKSPWGNPVQQPKPPQPDSAWGAPPNSNKAWGNPDEPKQAWGQPQQSQWNQSSNSDNRSGTSSAWGGSAPPTAKPPSSRTGPGNNNYGSWNKDDNEGKKQQSFPQENQTQSVSACAGWLPILDIPQEIVTTGWGQLSPSDPSKPFGLDDGTYVWGDSKEHNAWVTEMSAKNVLRMKQLKQKAAAAATAGGTSTMQSPSVPSSKPPSTPSSEDGAPVGFGSSDQKKTGWDETGSSNSTSTSRPKTESESGGEWQNLPRTPSEESKWGNDSQHSSSWGANTRSSTQSREPMQTWNEESPNISSSIGHWGDEEWDRGSQNSDASSGIGRRKLSVSDNNGNRNPSQVALKLRALMERGLSKEDAEMMLKKHNMNLESAFEELAPGQDHLKTTSDMDLQFSNMKLHGGSGDMSSNFSMNMMQNMRNKGMNNLGAVGGPGFHGQGPQNQRMPQQKFQGQMSSGNNQPLRGNFNPMQQQQQQQQQQLLQAMAAGINQNSQIPQQLIHALQQNPQLLAQLQNMQGGGNSGKPGYMNRQSDFFRNQFMPQNQAGQSRPRAPFSNNRPMMQGDADMNNPNFLSGAGFGQDMGGHQPQQSRMEQFFSKQQRQQQQQQQQNRVFNRHPGNLPKPMRSDENNSRSTSPAASDSMPNSADSAFSDSSVWPFSQPSVDDQGDGVPEFKPGVPWKPRTFDVANDPDATPGSVGSLSSTLSVGKTPGREREKHDDLNGILMRPMKPPHGGNGHQVWGHGNRRSQSTSGGWNYQESGSVFQRQQSLPGFGSRPNRPGPPPGLENNPRNSNWNRAGSWDAGSWSGSDGMSGGSNWLVLRNVGNVDSSYLHLLCRQHGVVEQFNLNQAQGMALVAYKNRDDAMKARQALNSPSFGISANFVNPNEIGALVGGGTTGGSQWSNGQNKLWDDGGMHNNQSQWNGSGLGGVGLPGMQGSLWSPGPMAGGNGGIGSWGGSDMPMTPNLPLLPEDLLN